MLSSRGRVPWRGPVMGLCVSAISIAAVVIAPPAHAEQTAYAGYDRQIDRFAPRPWTDLSASMYQAAVAGIGADHVVTFEGAPIGLFHTLDLGDGVTLSGADLFGGDQVIRAGASACVDTLCGFNTTPFGAKYLQIYGGQVTFDFATPVSAFSFLMGGAQIDGIKVDFAGEHQSYYVPGQTGLSFFGLTDPDLSVSSFTIDIGNDIVSLDDLHFTFAGEGPVLPPAGDGGGAGVPEPSAWALMILGFGGVGALLRTRRRPGLAWLEFSPRH
jgi:hypothetical protein